MSERKNPEKDCRCDPDQYAMLQRCSEANDVTEWNAWRKANPQQEIWLEGADFRSAHLQGAAFRLAHLEGANFGEAHLQGAAFRWARLEGADFRRAHLEGAHFSGAHLEEADFRLVHFKVAAFRSAHLDRANFHRAHLEGANFRVAHLEGTHLDGAHLAGAHFHGAHLKRADFSGAHIKRADFNAAHLEGADFVSAEVDGGTLVTKCSIDERTDFSNVGLDAMRIDAGIKVALQYNRRKKAWQEWYTHHRWCKWLVRSFWWASDYGQSMGRIAAVFSSLSLFFAVVYWSWAWADKVSSGATGIIKDLMVPGADWLEVLFRSLYFSIVTMTTLGFGDMHAQPHRAAGHVFLVVQVLLGYFLLGALITRLGIMFTSDAPIARKGTMPRLRS